MILGDVVDIVGHRASHIFLVVAAELFEQGEEWFGGFNKLVDLQAPGKAGSGAFGGKAAQVKIVVLSPFQSLVQGAAPVVDEERTNGEFSAKALGHFTQHIEAVIKVVHSDLGDHIGHRHDGPAANAGFVHRHVAER